MPNMITMPITLNVAFIDTPIWFLGENIFCHRYNDQK
jgi:hypothetical protein